MNAKQRSARAVFWRSISSGRRSAIAVEAGEDGVRADVDAHGQHDERSTVSMQAALEVQCSAAMEKGGGPAVRLGHRAPFNPPADFVTVDEARLCAAYLAEARAIAGAGAVTGVRIIQQVPKSTRVAAGG